MQDLPPLLVAEDDDDDFFFLRRAVRQASLENPLLRFRDGAELIRFLDQIPVAELGPAERATWLLLLDITMPVVNGFEVLKWLGTRKGLPKVKPIMLSGSYRPDDIQRATRLGAIDYLVKPITAEMLATIAARKLVPTIRS
jgi:CheY-like chemotaxis protein